jgi:hypothetical protein
MIDLNASRTRRTLGQERIGIFPSLAGRIPLTRGGETIVYGALGAGVLDSHLIGGDHRIGAGLTMAVGASAPLVRDALVAHLEARYLITHDFDSDDSMNENLEFSGSQSRTTARGLFGGHQDTRFLPILIGLSWQFR